MSNFVVFQSGGPIYGVGETRQQAQSDSAEWLDNGEADALRAEMYRPGSAVDGGLYWAPCTEALAARVKADGGDLVYEINGDGYMDIAE